MAAMNTHVPVNRNVAQYPLLDCVTPAAYIASVERLLGAMADGEPFALPVLLSNGAHPQGLPERRLGTVPAAHASEDHLCITSHDPICLAAGQLLSRITGKRL